VAVGRARGDRGGGLAADVHRSGGAARHRGDERVGARDRAGGAAGRGTRAGVLDAAGRARVGRRGHHLAGGGRVPAVQRADVRLRHPGEPAVPAVPGHAGASGLVDRRVAAAGGRGRARGAVLTADAGAADRHLYMGDRGAERGRLAGENRPGRGSRRGAGLPERHRADRQHRVRPGSRAVAAAADGGRRLAVAAPALGLPAGRRGPGHVGAGEHQHRRGPVVRARSRPGFAGGLRCARPGVRRAGRDRPDPGRPAAARPGRRRARPHRGVPVSGRDPAWLAPVDPGRTGRPDRGGRGVRRGRADP
jgi:hypothetical protein